MIKETFEQRKSHVLHRHVNKTSDQDKNLFQNIYEEDPGSAVAQW